MNGLLVVLLALLACITIDAQFSKKLSMKGKLKRKVLSQSNPIQSKGPSLLKTDGSAVTKLEWHEGGAGACPGSVTTLNRFISNPGIKCPVPDNWVVNANAFTDKSNWMCLEEPTQLDTRKSPETPSCDSFCESFTGYKCYRAQQLGSGKGPKDPLQTCKLDNPWVYLGPSPSGHETDGCEERFRYLICQCGTPPVTCEGVVCEGEGETCLNGVCKTAICHEETCDNNGICVGDGVCNCPEFFSGPKCEIDTLNVTARAAYLANAVAEHKAKLRYWEKQRIKKQFNEAIAENPKVEQKYRSARHYQKYLNRLRHRAYVERVRRSALAHANDRIAKHVAEGGSLEDPTFVT